MDAIVISVGGSVIAPDKIDIEYTRRLSVFLSNCSAKFRIFIVVGGGKVARAYINACRKFKADESYLDEIGIDCTRLNAKVLISAIGEKVYPVPAKDFNEALIQAMQFPIIVMGGTHPGHTTDAVACMLAERVRCKKLIIMTDVDGIYTSDPKKDKDAVMLRQLNFKRLMEITGKTETTAGSSGVIDPLGAKIIARARIPTYVINGRDLNALRNVIDGKRFKGSIVKG